MKRTEPLKQLPKDRTRLKPEQYKKIKGTLEGHQYVFHKKRNLWIKNIKKIRGVAEARRKAKTYILATDIGNIGEMYLMKDGTLTQEKKLAKLFYHGFDNPEVRKAHWNSVAGVKFHTQNF